MITASKNVNAGTESFGLRIAMKTSAPKSASVHPTPIAEGNAPVSTSKIATALLPIELPCESILLNDMAVVSEYKNILSGQQSVTNAAAAAAGTKGEFPVFPKGKTQTTTANIEPEATIHQVAVDGKSKAKVVPIIKLEKSLDEKSHFKAFSPILRQTMQTITERTTIFIAFMPWLNTATTKGAASITT